MARGFAHVSMVGNLTRDPELKTLPSGSNVCELGVAVSTSFKDASGQWQEKPGFYDVAVFGGQADACARYLSKGQQVAIDGRLDYRSWEAQDGSKRNKVSVVASSVVFPQRGEGSGSQQAQRQMAPAGDFQEIDFGGDDDIPF